MKRFLRVNSQGLIESEVNGANITVYKDLTTDEEQKFLKKYNLPKDVFYFDDLSAVASRYENITNEQLGETIVFVLTNVLDTGANSDVENRLETHIFILGEQQLFWFVKRDEVELDKSLLEKYSESIDSLQSVLVHAGLESYTNFTEELTKQKKRIDRLNKQARDATNKNLLLEVTETERNLVLLNHVIDAQEESFQYLLKNEQFLHKLDNDPLVHDIKWYNNQVKKLVHMYRDLFDAVSSLFSDIISNNLNKTMKFLSSFSLILAATSLIAELWGMNTGGLPLEYSDYGTYIMIFIALLSGLSMYGFLKRKNFFDD